MNNAKKLLEKLKNWLIYDDIEIVGVEDNGIYMDVKNCFYPGRKFVNFKEVRMDIGIGHWKDLSIVNIRFELLNDEELEKKLRKKYEWLFHGSTYLDAVLNPPAN